MEYRITYRILTGPCAGWDETRIEKQPRKVNDIVEKQFHGTRQELRVRYVEEITSLDDYFEIKD